MTIMFLDGLTGNRQSDDNCKGRVYLPSDIQSTSSPCIQPPTYTRDGQRRRKSCQSSSDDNHVHCPSEAQPGSHSHHSTTFQPPQPSQHSKYIGSVISTQSRCVVERCKSSLKGLERHSSVPHRSESNSKYPTAEAFLR